MGQNGLPDKPERTFQVGTPAAAATAAP